MPNVKTFNRALGVQERRIEISKLVAANLGGGMDVNTDSADLDPSQFINLQNITNQKDSIKTRDGSILYTPSKPDSNPVLGFFSFVKEDGTVKLLRFTSTNIYLSQASSWLAVTGASLTGSNDDKFTPIVANDRFLFTNNGADVVQEFLPSSNTVVPLGNAPQYKFITAFGDRIVGFNLAGNTPNSIQVGWSGNLNYSVWDSITDPTAGYQPLYDSSSDLTDPGVGIFSMSNTLLLVRERSIWEGTLTGSFTEPFSFYTKIPGTGCDAPYSIQKIPGGIVFLDSRTRNVYVYSASHDYTGATIEAIGTPVRDQILNYVTDPSKVFSSYNTRSQEYFVCIYNSLSQLVQCWKYNFLYKTWSYDVYQELTSMNVLDFGSDTLTYGELPGSYSGLIGSYASLGMAAVKQVTKFLGYKQGYISKQTVSIGYDEHDATNPPIGPKNGVGIVADTKDFWLPSNDMYFAEFRLEFNLLANHFNIGGYDLVIYYRLDGQSQLYLMIADQTITMGNSLLVVFKKQIKCRRISFSIRGSAQLVLKEYEVWVSQGADSRR